MHMINLRVQCYHKFNNWCCNKGLNWNFGGFILIIRLYIEIALFDFKILTYKHQNVSKASIIFSISKSFIPCEINQDS